MVAQRLDGKLCAASVEEELQGRISACQEKGITPHLAVVIVGDDPASHVYVNSKVKACKRLGIKSTHIELAASSTEAEVRDVIHRLNRDTSLHGILVQSPLPSHMDEEGLTDLIDPSKDVDGFHPQNLGRLVQGRLDGMLPCTPSGVMRMLMGQHRFDGPARCCSWPFTNCRYATSLAAWCERGRRNSDRRSFSHQRRTGCVRSSRCGCRRHWST